MTFEELQDLLWENKKVYYVKIIMLDIETGKMSWKKYKLLYIGHEDSEDSFFELYVANKYGFLYKLHPQLFNKSWKLMEDK